MAGLSNGPKILFADIECAPITAHVWGLRDNFVGLNQIVQDPYIIGMGYRWSYQKSAKYLDLWDMGRKPMLEAIRDLLDEADVVSHYNGDSFDLPWIDSELAVENIDGPSPYKSIDLYKVVKRSYRFPSYKLDYVSKRLLGIQKLPTGGHQLWVDCINGDEKARKRMSLYCRRDVDLLPPLLDRVRYKLGSQVNFALYEGSEAGMACQKCGSAEALRPKGWAYTATRKYRQYWCRPSDGGCGGWSRDVRSAEAVGITGVVTR